MKPIDLANLIEEYYSVVLQELDENPTLWNFSQWIIDHDTAHKIQAKKVKEIESHVVGRRLTCMTGKEWLERFMSELPPRCYTKEVQRAANIAAGLEEKS